jgi:outer membrane lipoprotein-sorting protein
MKKILLLLLACLPALLMNAQAEPNPKEIIRKMDENYWGDSRQGTMKMTIIRPTWQREMTIKSWSKGDDYMLMLITAPARDKGTAFLKRENEIWNWQPTIDRVIKLPPSMMSQSWMGSDFTNDDLVQQVSVVDDFTHKLLGSEVIEDRDCYKIEMIPHEDAAVVWGKLIVWVDKQDYLELKTEFYDEDEYLINTMRGMDIQTVQGRVLPMKFEVVPADEEGKKTVVEYLDIEFDKNFSDNFFSIQNMKRID